MENLLFPCKAKSPILIPFINHKTPNHVPSKISHLLAQNLKSPSLEVEPPLPPPPPPPPLPHTRRAGEGQLRRLCRDGKLHEAVTALESGSPITTRTYLLLLQACIDSGSLEAGRRLHSSLPSVKNANPFVETKLVSMYAKCGELKDARNVFDVMRERNLFTWSAMIGGYGRENQWEEVVRLFHRMIVECVNPDAFLLPKILQACANTEDLATGTLLHSLTIRLGFLEESHVGNSILNMYAKCGELTMANKFFHNLHVKDRVTWNSIIYAHFHCGKIDEVVKLFDRMRSEKIEPCLITWNILIASYNQNGKPNLALDLMKEMESRRVFPDVFTWTCIISGLLQNNKMSQSLDLFCEMRKSEVEPNNMTIACAVSACAALKYLKNGRELHGYAIKKGGLTNLLVVNSLVGLYAKSQSLEDAERIFDAVDKKDVFTWNSMIGGYMQAGCCGKAQELFSRMEALGLRRNVVTWNVMISGYIQNGEEEKAIEHFEKMEVVGVRRNPASWNALISGYLQNRDADEAFRVFRRMQLASEKSNSITISSMLSACANLVSAWKVREIHAYALRFGMHLDSTILNSLIDSYSKSGDLSNARVLFDVSHSRDPVSWNSMIAGYVFHGCSNAARELFDRMKREGVKPNQPTYISMIVAYGLDGLVNDGKELFMRMLEHMFSPGMEVYAAMIELFGRSRRLTEAYKMIKEMLVEPDSTIWNSLLTASRYCGNAKLASLATENLIRLDPQNSIVQGKASSLQAIRNNTWNASNVNGFHSCCWMEHRRQVYTVFTDDKMSESMSPVLAEVSRISKVIVLNIPNSGESRLGIEEEMEDGEDDEAHCETKAIMFSIMNTPSFEVIRIIKNRRMCAKCHGTAKSASKMCGRDILVKDSKCLHHFRDGKCSCKDYW